MADFMEEVIEEPFLDAAACSFHSPSSDAIQHSYKLKYPNVYSLSASTILELLDNKEVYSELANSVQSFITRVRQSNEANSQGYHKNNNEVERMEFPVYETNWSTYSTTRNKSNCASAAGVYKISSSSTDLSGYDSVHSIKVPLRTYKNKARHPPKHVRRAEPLSSCCPSVSDVTQQMNGLVFDRVEKPIPLPLQYKNSSSAIPVQRKDGGFTVAPYIRKQAKNVNTMKKK